MNLSTTQKVVTTGAVVAGGVAIAFTIARVRANRHADVATASPEFRGVRGIPTRRTDFFATPLRGPIDFGDPKLYP